MATTPGTVSLTKPAIVLAEDAQALLFREAHTPTAFTDEPVTDEQLRRVHDLVKWAPTSMNSQPLRMAVVRSDEARARITPHMAEGNRVKVETAPVVLVLAADVDFHDELPVVFPQADGARDRFAADEDARCELAVRNSFLQAGYLIVGLRAAGLAPWPMGGFDGRGVGSALWPDGRHKAILVVAVGYAAPGAHHARNPRLSFDEVARVV